MERKVHADPSEINRTVKLLLERSGRAELRAFGVVTNGRESNYFGYYDNPEKLVKDAVELSGRASAIYVTLNRINSALLARSHNRFQRAKSGLSTSDVDIVGRLWLLVDCDPRRPSGISSTDAEHSSAKATALRIRTHLGERGWPDPILADSGNGWHLVYAIDLPPDDNLLVKRCLSALNLFFGDDKVEIDQSVYNPARICKLHGTVARKGDSTPDRPHRVSRLIEIPKTIDIVPRKLLEELAAEVPDEGMPSHPTLALRNGFDVEAYLATHCPDAIGPLDWNGGQKWILPECPFNPEHSNGSAYVLKLASGAISAGCHHNSCRDKDWHSLRDIKEPRWAVASSDGEDHGEVAPKDEWPDPPDEATFYGLAGEIVRLIEPHTEADPVAILLQLLVAFGNLIGRNAHFVVESTPHYLNLFAVLVGRTSKGRKGTSWGHAEKVLAEIDQGWTSDRLVHGGLSSGEGVIWNIRDPIFKMERNRKTKECEEVLVDPGVEDKRLLVIEGEYANALRVMQRDGNNLSPTLRTAWDRGDLRTLTKNSPVRATGAHVSVIGHITDEELRRYLDRTEMANGFGNRHLWACVRRSKLLPEGGQFDEVALDPLSAKVEEAAEFARGAGILIKDDDAAKAWGEVYGELSDGKPGMFGAMVSRGEAQVMRLSALYAILDRDPRIRAPHLNAALALWEYCEASVQYIFGDSLGDPMADEILRALKHNPKGLTRTQISRDLFGGNRNKQGIDRALGRLLAAGLANKLPRAGSRSPETWVYTKHEHR